MLNLREKYGIHAASQVLLCIFSWHKQVKILIHLDSVGRQYYFPTYCLACDDGYFGDGCATQCYCESEACNKATGKCPHERCQRGWMGATCSEGIITNLKIL